MGVATREHVLHEHEQPRTRQSRSGGEPGKRCGGVGVDEGSKIEGVVVPLIALSGRQTRAKVFGLASSQDRWRTGPALLSRSCPGSKKS